jgi:hypothetical protein
MRNPYECLAVPRTATAAEISKSFRHLAKHLHPDVNNDPKAAALFAELSVAYDILNDDQKRRAFDRRAIDANRLRMRRGVTLAAAALTLSVISTLALQRLLPLLEARIITDKALSRAADSETRVGAAVTDKSDRVQSELRLLLQQNDSYATDNTVPLGLQVSGEAVGLSLDISGLPSGTTLSSGQPIGGGKWRILAADIGNALIRPPAGVRGALDFAVELRLADDTIVDSGSFRLEWTPATATASVQAANDGVITGAATDSATTNAPPIRQNSPPRTAEFDRERIEALMARGRVTMSQTIKPDLAGREAVSRQAKHKPLLAHPPSNEPPASRNDPSGVYIAGQRVGADPDPNIRAQLLRDDASRELQIDTAGRQLLAGPVMLAIGRP